MIATGNQDRSSFKINYKYIDRDPSNLSESEKVLQELPKLIIEEESESSALVGIVTLVAITLLIAIILCTCNYLLNRSRKRAMTKIQMLQSGGDLNRKGYKNANESGEMKSTVAAQEGP